MIKIMTAPSATEFYDRFVRTFSAGISETGEKLVYFELEEGREVELKFEEWDEYLQNIPEEQNGSMIRARISSLNWTLLWEQEEEIFLKGKESCKNNSVLKLWFQDCSWYGGITVVAMTEDEAREIMKNNHPYYAEDKDVYSKEIVKGALVEFLGDY